MKTGIALSGGGIRATIFHLGVFKYLAEKGMLEDISHISSVSGASLCVGLIFACNGYKWPSSEEFSTKVLESAGKAILGHNIQKSALIRLPVSFKYWGNKVGLVAKMIRKKWKLTGTLQDLPDYPKWDINCTTFETGKNFRINKKEMGGLCGGLC